MLRHTKVFRYIDEAARQGSFRGAAARLNVAPSALQRRIADVEADLGVKLFERSRAGMRLTAAGEAFLPWIRRQEAELDRVRSHIEDLQGMQSGTIRIACSQAVATGMLTAEIVAFRQRYRNVGFQVLVRSHAEAFALLAAYEVDLVLVFRPARTPGITILATLNQQLMAIMRPGHALAQPGPVRLRDCAAHPIALLDRSFGSRQILDEVLTGGSTRFDIALESNSFELLRRFVEATDAIGFQIEAGVLAEQDLFIRPVQDRGGCGAPLILAKGADLGLTVAAEGFARQLAARLDAMQAGDGMRRATA